MDAHLKEIQKDSRQVYDGHFLKVQKDTIVLPDGKESIREYIKHPGAVTVLPLFDDGSVLMERQFRYPLDRVFIEFPAGKIDPGEDTLECAKRELKEETGYTASQWEYVCTIHNAIAYSDEHLVLYVARGLKEGEFLDIYKAPLSGLLEQVRNGQITDVKTVIGVFWLEKILSGAWTPPARPAGV
ncbi:MAG: Methanol dehydrogenase activator [Herbaspirillum frisingense]|uniref:GDP-mannose pyrophosphatase n=1 Tax=Herbaspirillum frisingense TaxID=92645 RepID=A0A7V8FZ72_9BURK|nr:MAG: Methanol dehydrogenase activator [Herbaspirillum frisingense]